MALTPIFLFSLPRSGSTLTQRVLAAHDGVATASEPWVLLPLLAPLRPGLVLSDGWQRTVRRALGDFNAQLPGGQGDYEQLARRFALTLYEHAAGPEARFFVDKTPPYHHIAAEIIRVFPDARFVFLWRDPLAVLASVVETLCDGRWRVYDFRADLFHGMANLAGAFARHRERVHGVRYEDLLDGTEAWESLGRYLGLEFDPEALSRFGAVRLEGQMGDQTGAHRYAAVSREPLDKWRATIDNPVRRAWAARWLRWIGRERLTLMGYDLDELLAALRSTPASRARLPQDMCELGVAAAREAARSRARAANGLVSTWRQLLAPLPH